MAEAAVAPAVTFTLGTPKGWYRLPQAGVALGSDWADSLTERLTAERGFDARQSSRLRGSLGRALERAARQGRPERVRLVYLGFPELPVVRAWAQLSLLPGHGETPESFAAALAGASAAPGAAVGTVRVRGREVTRETLAGQPAVVVHELVTVPGRQPEAVQHRFVATLFVPGAFTVQLQLSTPDLTAFADLPAVGRAIADTVRLGDVPSADAWRELP